MTKGKIIVAVCVTVALIGGFFMYSLYSDAQKQEEDKKRRQAYIQSRINLLDKEREASILLQKERDARYVKFLAESEKSLAANADASNKMLANSPARQPLGKDIKSVYQDFWDCIIGERVQYQRPRNQQDHVACTVDYTYGTLGYESCVNKRRGFDASKLAEQSCEAAFGSPLRHRQGASPQGKSVMIIRAEPN